MFAADGSLRREIKPLGNSQTRLAPLSENFTLNSRKLGAQSSKVESVHLPSAKKSLFSPLQDVASSVPSFSVIY